MNMMEALIWDVVDESEAWVATGEAANVGVVDAIGRADYHTANAQAGGGVSQWATRQTFPGARDVTCGGVSEGRGCCSGGLCNCVGCGSSGRVAPPLSSP